MDAVLTKIVVAFENHPCTIPNFSFVENSGFLFDGYPLVVLQPDVGALQ